MLRHTELSPLSRLVQRVDAAADGAATGDEFATGFPSVDKWLGGGLRGGDLVAIGGEVGVGKSALALAMALRMAQAGINSAFFTGEMTVDRVMERVLAIEGRARIDDIRRGALDEFARAAVGGAAVRLRDGAPIIQVVPPGGVDTLADAVRRSGGVQVVLVDPLQALALGVRDQAEELAVAVRALKSLAVATGTVIVVTTDLAGLPASRADQRPTLGDFGALGAVKQHADIVMGVFREEMGNPGAGVEGATELLILKNRNGGTGYVDLYFYKQWLRFEDMLDPDR
ncbi:MAG TPA: DnaB-like helicase C-terminal domain-containing protein [Gemmatimonadaceae bacterium]|nr:DnaB-like helicase C-terminal domain-containing protein [Gemmatimonadaceae bacterium]